MTDLVSARLVYSDEPPHASVTVQETLLPEGLLMRCQQLHEADKVAERRKSVFGGLGIAGIAVTVFTVFLGAVGDAPKILLVGVVLALVTVVLFALRKHFGRGDIDDRKLHVVSRIVDVLRMELHDERPLELWMDFRGYDEGGSRTLFFGSTKSEVFDRPWLKLALVLQDGTAVRIEAKSTCKRKLKSKRKYTKVKDTIVDDLSLSITPPKGVTLDPAQSARAQGVLRSGGPLPAPRGLRVKPRALELGFRLGPARRAYARTGWSSSGLDGLLDGHKALGMLMLSYRAMHAVRQG